MCQHTLPPKVCFGATEVKFLRGLETIASSHKSENIRFVAELFLRKMYTYILCIPDVYVYDETSSVPVTVEITRVSFACWYFTRDWRSITFCFRGRSGVAPGRMNPQGGVGQHGDFHQELHWNPPAPRRLKTMNCSTKGVNHFCWGRLESCNLGIFKCPIPKCWWRKGKKLSHDFHGFSAISLFLELLT